MYTFMFTCSIFMIKNNKLNLDKEIQEEIASSMTKQDKHPTLNNIKRILNIFYTIFFSVSILTIPLIKMNLMGYIVFIVNLFYLLIISYYYKIIKNKMSLLTDEVKEKYKIEMEQLEEFRP